MLHRGLEERVTLCVAGQDGGVKHPASCDLCSQSIVGVRWKCLSCPDWDCCTACSASIREQHPHHSFVKLYKAADYVSNDVSDVKSSINHPNIICDGKGCTCSYERSRTDTSLGCNQHVRGARYKCMHPDCPDYDLCENCESAPIPVHPENHPMLKTRVPLRVDVTSTMDAAGCRIWRVKPGAISRKWKHHRAVRS